MGRPLTFWKKNSTMCVGQSFSGQLLAGNHREFLFLFFFIRGGDPLSIIFFWWIYIQLLILESVQQSVKGGKCCCSSSMRARKLEGERQHKSSRFVYFFVEKKNEHFQRTPKCIACVSVSMARFFIFTNFFAVRAYSKRTHKCKATLTILH